MDTNQSRRTKKSLIPKRALWEFLLYFCGMFCFARLMSFIWPHGHRSVRESIFEASLYAVLFVLSDRFPIGRSLPDTGHRFTPH
jgi:hypothetical protein